MSKKYLLPLFACVLSALSVFGQNGIPENKPKLIVGIVVDQMRWDYLQRFSSNFGEGGFKRLLNEGFSCNNTQLNYIPTVTSVGHSAIYSGSVPAITGIAGNNFYLHGEKVYCTEDDSVHGIGTEGKTGRMSPRNLLVTTVGDELKLSDNFKSKVIGISLKDRASILPAGHAADAAYWFDDESGHFITSSYYRNELPQWVIDFNKKDLAACLLKEDWNTLYPADSYHECTPDNTHYENAFEKGTSPVFPIRTSLLFNKKGYKTIRTTPYGNTLTLEMAKSALIGEKLGQGSHTDLLAVSLSSTDYIGHRFGTYSVETADTYFRLDRDLSDFIDCLNLLVGKDNYLLFLTADHAAPHNYLFMQENKMPADGWDVDLTLTELNEHLKKEFNVHSNLIKDIMNYQVFFDEDALSKENIELSLAKNKAIAFLSQNPAFAWVLDMDKLSTETLPQIVRERAINGYHRIRSGKIQIIMNPGHYEFSPEKGAGGTSHGTWSPYDAHIPLIFYGKNIPSGSSYRLVHMTDIAPTVCAMAGVQAPNGCIGEPIKDLVK